MGPNVYKQLQEELRAWEAAKYQGADAYKNLREYLRGSSPQGPFLTASICRYLYRYVHQPITLGQVPVHTTLTKGCSQHELLTAAPQGTESFLIAGEMTNGSER